MFLDHECNEARRAKLAQHLDECSPCLERYGLDEHLKTLLAAKCGGEHAPDALKERLRAKIRKTVLEHGGVTVEATSVTVVEAGEPGED
jgi:mycothiol system anti-sigma-R factor